MKLGLNNILNLSPTEQEQSKVELSLSMDGHNSFEQWSRLSDDVKENGTWELLYRNQNKKQFQKGQFVFSFIKINLYTDQWLLVSAGKILKDDLNSNCNVEILKRFIPLFGKLVITYHKSGQGRDYKYTKFIETATVFEICPSLYGDKFPGYDSINIDYLTLECICHGKSNREWREALSKQRGVYLVTDTKAGRFYVGSAYGDNGILQRWTAYANTYHGGNKEFREIFKTEGKDYFTKYMRYTILETFNSNQSNSSEYAISRENHWKDILRARDANIGMNKN